MRTFEHKKEPELRCGCNYNWGFDTKKREILGINNPLLATVTKEVVVIYNDKYCPLCHCYKWYILPYPHK